jgi:hypothetical protein
MPPRCHIDHITVIAATLDEGARFVQAALGVAPQTGGEHPRMGTHNLLLKLGDSAFLEVIAVNPLAPPPARPRWFALDSRDARSAPALTTWVVRSSDIHATQAGLAETLGEIEPMSRGALDWLITIPADGSLPLGGVAPALIQWSTPTHPAAGLQDHGLSLLGLELFHPEPERLAKVLRPLELGNIVSVSGAASPRLLARIMTPDGLKTLSI